MSFFHGKVVEFLYVNHRGVEEIRRVVPRYIWFGKSEWHGEKEQWFLRATCLERQSDRDFQISVIQGWELSEDQTLPWRL